jgi:hypothetical protein
VKRDYEAEVKSLTAQLDSLREQGRWLDWAVDRCRAIEQIVGAAVPRCPVPNPAWDGAIMPHDWNWKQECRRCGESMRSAILSTSEHQGNSVQHWHAKAKAYGGMVRGAEPALRRAGHPVDATGEGGAVEGIRKAVESLVAERDELRHRLSVVQSDGHTEKRHE